MEIQEGAEPTPSAPLQAGHARFWQRPSHMSHRDSLGLSAPRSDPGREWAQGWGRELEEMGRTLTLLSLLPPSPAGPSGSQPGPGTWRREAGSVGPA